MNGLQNILTTPSWLPSCTYPNAWFWCWNSPWWWSYEHFRLHQAAIAETQVTSELREVKAGSMPDKFW